ncbi:MAG: hypothetical protein ACR2QC_12220 [Gammaproteobacteria bacterium]
MLFLALQRQSGRIRRRQSPPAVFPPTPHSIPAKAGIIAVLSLVIPAKAGI